MADNNRSMGKGLRITTNVRKSSAREEESTQPIKPLPNQSAHPAAKENVYPAGRTPGVSSKFEGKSKGLTPVISKSKGGLDMNAIMKNMKKKMEVLEADPNWIDTWTRMPPIEENEFPLVLTPPSATRSPCVSPISSPEIPKFEIPLPEPAVAVHSPYPDTSSFVWSCVDIDISVPDEEDF